MNPMTVEFAEEILQDTDGYDLIMHYEDLFLSEKERASRIAEGNQSDHLSKIRCNAGDKKTSGVVKENKLNAVYGNKYRIPMDHDILKDHGVSFPNKSINQSNNQSSLLSIREAWLPSCPSQRLMFKTYDYKSIYK